MVQRFPAGEGGARQPERVGRGADPGRQLKRNSAVRHLVASAIVLGSLGAAATAVADDRPAGGDSPFHFAAIPAIAFSSDVGFALGAATFLYRPGGVEGRFDRLTASGVYTTNGPRALLLRWEQPRIGTSRWWGLVADLRASDDNQEPYWGEGADVGLVGISPGAGAAPDPYRFHDRRLFLSFTLRPPVAATPQPYFRLRWLGVDVVDPGTLLPQSRPPGWQGGASLLAEAGLVIDTRDQEVNTQRGWHAYVAGFGSPPLGFVSDGSFYGVDAAVSLFVPLAERVVLATRVLYDGKFGDVPFYERYGIEGLAYTGGMGGAGTIRGVARQRFPGDQKALATVELRGMLREWTAWDQYPVQLGAALGVDAGGGKQQGYDVVGAVGGFAGLRLVWDRAVVVRFEVGYAAQGAPAFYFVTGEQF